MIDPVTATAIATALSSVIGGLAGGSRDKKAMERQKQQQGWLEKIGAQRTASLKPEVPYYQTRAVPYLSDMVQRAVMGNMGTHLGGDLLKKYGIDLSDYQNVAGLNKPYSQNPEVSKYYPGYSQPQTGTPNQGLRERLLRRYTGGNDEEGLGLGRGMSKRGGRYAYAA